MPGLAVRLQGGSSGVRRCGGTRRGHPRAFSELWAAGVRLRTRQGSRAAAAVGVAHLGGQHILAGPGNMGKGGTTAQRHVGIVKKNFKYAFFDALAIISQRGSLLLLLLPKLFENLRSKHHVSRGKTIRREIKHK